MSKRRPTRAERLARSVASREALIAKLEETLRMAPKDTPLERISRLQVRISNLRWRNAEPEDYFGYGSTQRQKAWPQTTSRQATAPSDFGGTFNPLWSV